MIRQDKLKKEIICSGRRLAFCAANLFGRPTVVSSYAHRNVKESGRSGDNLIIITEPNLYRVHNPFYNDKE